MYLYQTKIKLHETDAAGLLFFSNQFKLIHDAYESLLESIGFGFAELLKNKPYFLPIVHASSDFKSPLFVGDIIDITVIVDNIGTTSFTFTYSITNAKNVLVGTAKTVHVTMDKASQVKIPLPFDMLKKIKELYDQDH